MNVDSVARECNRAFYIIRLRGIKWRLENNNLLALGISPQRNVQAGEWDSRVVADAAHNQVIADQQRVLHGPGRNHARLADCAINQQKNQSDPEPGDNLPPHLLFHGKVLFGFFCFYRDFIFIEPGGRRSVLRSGLLPPPAHFLESFLSLKFLSFSEKIAVSG